MTETKTYCNPIDGQGERLESSYAVLAQAKLNDRGMEFTAYICPLLVAVPGTALRFCQAKNGCACRPTAPNILVVSEAELAEMGFRRVLK